MSTRNPNPAWVYHLGHNEQMQAALALMAAHEEFTALDPDDRTEEWKLADADTIKNIWRMFSHPHTTVTIIVNHSAVRLDKED